MDASRIGAERDARRAERERMVERQIAARGIADVRVLDAMRAVPREAFVPPDLAGDAYGDYPLPIGEGQTISQPYIVALMLAEARIGPAARVLEIGAGSGYAAALLAELAGEVLTIERHAGLAQAAAERLARLGVRKVRVVHGDGALGFPERAPYDAILAAATAPTFPDTWIEQLAPGGRLVAPVGESGREQLLRVKRTESGIETTSLGPVRFVPLV